MIEVLVESLQGAGSLIVILVPMVLIFLVIIIGHFWLKARQADIDASLKEEMLARGMSADDIKKVLEASSEKGSDEEG